MRTADVATLYATKNKKKAFQEEEVKVPKAEEYEF